MLLSSANATSLFGLHDCVAKGVWDALATIWGAVGVLRGALNHLPTFVPKLSLLRARQRRVADDTEPGDATCYASTCLRNPIFFDFQNVRYDNRTSISRLCRSYLRRASDENHHTNRIALRSLNTPMREPRCAERARKAKTKKFEDQGAKIWLRDPIRQAHTDGEENPMYGGGSDSPHMYKCFCRRNRL